MVQNSDNIKHESESLLEPMIFSERSTRRDVLLEPIAKIREKSKRFQESIPFGLTRPLVNFTRIMNSYYSNLIEGHKTHPQEIELAMMEPEDSAVEINFDNSVAIAHVKLETWIEQGNLNGSIANVENLKKLHCIFYENIPLQARKIKYPDSKQSAILVPGEFRNCFVNVGGHEPIHPNAISRFMSRFEQVYSKLDSMECLMSLAVTHHRFLWIHPFLDGNGRIARLMTQKMLQDSLNIDALWSLSRGIARNKQQYIIHLMDCDLKRRNDLDGVGHLSEEAMLKFTLFLFDICLDQIQFMSDSVDAKNLHERIELWYNYNRRKNKLPNKSIELLKLLLLFGELTRSEIISHTGLSGRQTQRITSALESIGAITSKHKKAAFKIHISPEIAESWFPGLIPPVG